MVLQKTRVLAATCGLAAMLLAVPAESQACGLFDCLFGWCGGARTTYRVPYQTTAYAPACCPSQTPCVTQTCRYVPQTCYRTVCQRVPVRTCRAVTTCDPCTGCPVTTYRPITVWTTQRRLVPYTTYRTVCSPSVTYPVSYAAIGTAGSCCPPRVITSEPVQVAPGTSTPGVQDVPSTFQNNGGVVTEEQPQPTPDPNSDKTSAGPSIFPDRTTSLPVRQAAHYRLISSPSQPAPLHKARLNDGGWRAARD